MRIACKLTPKPFEISVAKGTVAKKRIDCFEVHILEIIWTYTSRQSDHHYSKLLFHHSEGKLLEAI